MNYQEAITIRPVTTKVEVPCFGCGKPLNTQVRYVKQKMCSDPSGGSIRCLSCINLGRGDDVRAKIAAGVSKANGSVEGRKRLSDENKRRLASGWRPTTPEMTDELKARISEGSKGLWQDPEYRRNQKAGLDPVRNDPKWRKNMSKAQRKAWTDGMRVRQSEKLKEVWNPEGELYQRTKEERGWLDPSQLEARKLRRKQRNKEYAAKNADALKEYRRARRIAKRDTIRLESSERGGRLREERRKFVLWMMGGACGDCGCSDLELLHLHHVNGDGGEHRKTTRDMWKWAFANREEAQAIMKLLCANCHCMHHYDEDERSTRAQAKSVRKRRKKVIEALGGKCSCGERRYECLQIDHIEPNASGERASLAEAESSMESFRVMCANCNHLRGRRTANLHPRLLSYVFDGQIDVPADEWAEIKGSFDKEQISHALGRIISGGYISMPTVSLSDSEMEGELSALARSNPGQPGRLSMSCTGQKLSAHFTDGTRFKAVGRSHSAEEIWGDLELARKLAAGLFIWGANEGVTNQNFRRYLTSRMRIPIQFRPAAAFDLMRRLSVKTMYDPCGGWGDRMVAALAAGVDVHVNDVNPLLAGDYARMAEWAAGYSGSTVTITTMDASKFIPDGRFDLAFTSPPYFDTELYERDNPDQSYRPGMTEEEWAESFLVPLFKNMRAVAGVVALNVPHRLSKYLPGPDSMLMYAERKMAGGECGGDPVLIWH